VDGKENRTLCVLFSFPFSIKIEKSSLYNIYSNNKEMSTSDAAAAAKKLKASHKKQTRYVESLRAQIIKKGFNVTSLAEALLLPPPSPKVKKVPKETLAKAWIHHAYEIYASKYPAYLTTLPQEAQDAEKEKISKDGKTVKQNGLVANRNKTNFSKKMEIDHAADYAAFKTSWEAAHSATPVEEESSAESSAESAAEESAAESVSSSKKKKSSKASPAAATSAPAPAPSPVLTVETPVAAKKGGKKSPAATATAVAEETPVPVVAKTGRAKVNAKK
jgi:hypothetical protein